MDVETGNPTDESNESALARAALELSAATTPAARRKAWAELQRLHARRSPKRVRDMEIQRGLLEP